jgi:hypothetical protein
MRAVTVMLPGLSLQSLHENSSRTTDPPESPALPLPQNAEMGLGCGNPISFAALQTGEVVVDLGSGGGIDSFLAAKRVGPERKMIGVDMTP